MSRAINSAYLEDETLDQLKEHFQEDPEFESVTLAQFFTKNGLETIIDEIIGSDFENDYNEIKHRRQISTIKTLEPVLNSEEFAQIFSKITGDQLKLSDEITVQKYGHKDYKIIHDETVLPPGYDIIIDLTPEWDDNLGGYVAYTDGEGQFYTIGSTFGSVSIIKREENLHYFVKYVNHYAENLNRYLVILNTEVER